MILIGDKKDSKGFKVLTVHVAKPSLNLPLHIVSIFDQE